MMVISPKELKIHLKSIKPFMEVTKRTELPESLAFKVEHPEKLRVFFHIRVNITLCLRPMLVPGCTF